MSRVPEKDALGTYCEALRNSSANAFAIAVDRFFDPKAQINIFDPFNCMSGAATYVADFLTHLHRAFGHLRRSDYISIDGRYEGGDWVPSLVTPRLPARGVRGLWVADVSIMAAITYANTNAPSMMIGYRSCSIISEDCA
ncbi:MAG: GMC oxidoreductase [Paracoccaceae bacterium]